MSANFTPSQSAIKDLKPFRFWCQKVLPTVYDDSLSYYELLTKVVNYLNDTIDNVEALNDNVQNIYDAYILLQNYVNDYFDNNLPQLVSDKLDEMAENGTLTALIKAYIDPYFDEKSAEIEESFDAQNDRIDEAISDQNDVLSAQTNSINQLTSRMDAFVNQHSGLSGETLLYDGSGTPAYTTGSYLSLSDALANYKYLRFVWKHRGEVCVQDFEINTEETPAQNYNLRDTISGPAVQPSGVATWEMCNIVVINATDANTNELEIGRATVIDNSGYNDGPVDGNMNTGILKVIGIKDVSDTEVVDARVGADGTIYSNLEERLNAENSELKNTLTKVSKQINVDTGTIESDMTSQYNENGYIMLAVGVGNAVDIENPVPSSQRNWIVVPCNSGDYFVVTGTGGANPRIWGLLDSNKTLLSVAQQEHVSTGERVDVTEDGYFVSNVAKNYTYSLTYYTEGTEKVLLSNVKAYGAVGDGITDDTTAINTALSAVAGGVLFIPKGTYKISGTINIPSGTHVIGEGADSVLQVADSYSLTPYTWRADSSSAYLNRYPVIITDADSDSCVIEGLMLIGQSSAFVDENEDGFCIRGTKHIIRNVRVTKINYFPDDFSGRNCITPAWGITAIFADNVLIENCYVDECGYECIGVEASDNVTVMNCKTGIANQTSIQIHRSTHHCKIVGCTMLKSSSCMTMDADPSYEMTDIHIDNNYIQGVVNFVAGGENSIFINNNYIGSGVNCNNTAYRNSLFLRGNRIGNRVGTYHDNAIITDNIINVDTGYYMIIHHGNKSVVQNNLGIGTVTDITVQTHE